MLDIVPRESALTGLAPLSKAVADRSESPGILALQAHRSQTKRGLRALSDDNLIYAPPVHLLGAMSIAAAGFFGIATLNGVGEMTGALIGAGAVTATYASMVFSWFRTDSKDKRIRAAAKAELEPLKADLARWLKETYGLSLADAELNSVSGSLIGFYEPLSPSRVWTFWDSTGASFSARIVQREDGELELHRPKITEIGESSLIQPLRKD